MSTLTIVLTVTEEGAYLHETAAEALSAASACGIDVELVVVSQHSETALQRLADVPCRVLAHEEKNQIGRAHV